MANSNRNGPRRSQRLKEQGCSVHFQKTRELGVDVLIGRLVADSDSSTCIDVPQSTPKKPSDKFPTNDSAKCKSPLKASRNGLENDGSINKRIERSYENLPHWGKKKRRRTHPPCFKKVKENNNGRIRSDGFERRANKGVRSQRRRPVRPASLAQKGAQPKMTVHEPKDQRMDASTGMNDSHIWGDGFQGRFLELLEQVQGWPLIPPIKSTTFVHSATYDSEPASQEAQVQRWTVRDAIASPTSSQFELCDTGYPCHEDEQGWTSMNGHLDTEIASLEDQMQGLTLTNLIESTHSSSPAADNCQYVTLSRDVEVHLNNALDALPAACGDGIQISENLRVGDPNKRLRLSALRSSIRKGECEELDLNKSPPSRTKRKKHRPKVKRENGSTKKRGRQSKKDKDVCQGNGLQDYPEQLVCDNGTVEQLMEGHRYSQTSSTSDKHEHSIQFEPCQKDNTKKRPLHIEGSNCHMFSDNSTLVSNDMALANNVVSFNREDDAFSTTACVHQNGIVSFTCQGHLETSQQGQRRSDTTQWKLGTHLNCDEDCPNQHGVNKDLVLHNFFAPSHLRERVSTGAWTQPIHGKELTLYQPRQGNEHTFYAQSLQNPEGLDSYLPLSLMPVADTSSKESAQLTLTQRNSTELTLAQANSTPDQNLQMVVYGKREIVLSKQIKRPKKPRAKVPIDAETSRVWGLLENGAMLPEDDNIKRAKEWEKERAAMKTRIDSFISKMHIVQGNRRFSPWKGSIVDSVVGAFLTQNVSDHLSSSAFMSVAARFRPVQKADAASPCAAESPREPRRDSEVQALVLEGISSASQISCASQEEKLVLSEEQLSSIQPDRFLSISPAEQPSSGSPGEQLSSTSPTEERPPFFSTEEQISDQGDFNARHHHQDDESANVEMGHCYFSGSFVHEKQSNSLAFNGEGNCSTADEHYQNRGLNSPASDDERNSSNGSEEGLGANGATRKEAWEGSGCRITVYARQTVCRKLNFETKTVGGNQGNQVSQGFESGEQSNSVEDHGIEVGIDVCRDQASSNTVQDGQDACSMQNFGTDVVGRNEGHPMLPAFGSGQHACSDLSYQASSDGLLDGQAFRRKRNGGTESVSGNDIISDQQSESGTAIVSSSSLQSGQDLSLQLKTVQESSQELNLQVKTFQDTVLPLFVSKTGKKRRFSVSSVSGIERAQLEENQKGRKKNYHRDWEYVRKQVLGISSDKEGDSSKEWGEMHNEQDSVNWEAVRRASLGELADTIKERGMHNVLSGRIKAFLTTLYEEHGRIDLEWLRKLSTEDAREYLMSVHGLGVKSVECIRLLTLHHLAFPVDTNVGRICVRLGWVPIEPLPEELQLHLLELYPVQESIQKYLWPRLCTLDQRTLYELHYQLITFGKVFCTKSKPNCNACPMRTECKHFASAYASARPLLTGTEDGKNGRLGAASAVEALPAAGMNAEGAPLLEYMSPNFKEISFSAESLPAAGKDIVGTNLLEYSAQDSKEVSFSEGSPRVTEEVNKSYELNCAEKNLQAHYQIGNDCKFYVEEPASPEQVHVEEITDIEDIGGKEEYIYDGPSDYCDQFLADTLPLVRSNIPCRSSGHEESSSYKDIRSGDNLSSTSLCPGLSASLSNTDYSCCQSQCSNLGEKCSGELVTTSPAPSLEYKSALSEIERPPYQSDIIAEEASNAIVPVPFEEAQIPVPKLKNIGRLRTVHFVYEIPDNHPLLAELEAREKDDPCFYLLAIWSPGETPESQQEIDDVCKDDSCKLFVDDTLGQDDTVSGTLLIPCRTAMRGSFPLNGTYFQVNEVFADFKSSLQPLQVPRSLLWNLRRRYVYFGTSVPNIFRGLSTAEITDCFWRGHVCVRGFDREERVPKPLVCRLHFPISKQQKSKKTAKSEL